MSKELTIQTLGQRQRLLEWSQKVAECRSSEMSVKRWCSENGTTPKTYYSWQKKVFAFMVKQQKSQLEPSSQEGCFLELPVPQEYGQQPSANLVASIQLGSASVNLYSGADLELVQTICQTLKPC